MNINFGKYVEQTVDWAVASGPKVVLILVLMFVGVKLSGIVAGRIFAVVGRRRKMDEEYKKRADTLSGVIAYLISVTVIVKARTKTRPIRQWAVGREFNGRLKKKFDEQDIEIPFPHVTLYMGQDKKGEAPPMNVAMQKGCA